MYKKVKKLTMGYSNDLQEFEMKLNKDKTIIMAITTSHETSVCMYGKYKNRATLFNFFFVN